MKLYPKKMTICSVYPLFVVKILGDERMAGLLPASMIPLLGLSAVISLIFAVVYIVRELRGFRCADGGKKGVDK